MNVFPSEYDEQLGKELSSISWSTLDYIFSTELKRGITHPFSKENRLPHLIKQLHQVSKYKPLCIFSIPVYTDYTPEAGDAIFWSYTMTAREIRQRIKMKAFL